MRETEAQRELIEAVREAGGAGTKLSNRFIVGVCDLLLKLPRYPAALIEAKLEEIGPKTDKVLVEPTTIQLRWLRDYHKAGMITGIVSFAVRGRQFGTCYLPISEFKHDASIRILTTDYAWCPMGPSWRKAVMLKDLIAYLEANK